MAYDRAPLDDQRKAVEQRLNARRWDQYARTHGKPEVMCSNWVRVALPTLIEEVEMQHRLHAEAWNDGVSE